MFLNFKPVLAFILNLMQLCLMSWVFVKTCFYIPYLRQSSQYLIMYVGDSVLLILRKRHILFIISKNNFIRTSPYFFAIIKNRLGTKQFIMTFKIRIKLSKKDCEFFLGIHLIYSTCYVYSFHSLSHKLFKNSAFVVKWKIFS